MENRHLRLVLFIAGFIVSTTMVFFTEFILCDKCMTNNIHIQRNNMDSWYKDSGIQKLVPFTRKNSSYISSTLDLNGLGNLMFQYASLVGIAQESGMKPVIPLDCKLNGIFQLDVEKWRSPRPGLEWGKVVEHKASAFDPVLGKLYIDEDVELVGYFQSWMYFRKSEETIRNHFRFHKEIENRIDQFFELEKYKLFRNKEVTNILYIGVHIRRGDMLEKDKVEYGYTVADSDYLKGAVKYYEREFPGKTLLFIVCSDDVTWAREHFPPTSQHVIFTHSNREFVDMATLARCNHSITTSGTFSWWSGWLAGGHVTYFKNYPRNGSRLEHSFSNDRKDYYPTQWIGL